MTLTEKDFEDVVQLITRETGMIPREGHRTGIRRFVEERLDELNSRLGFTNYAAFAAHNKDEMDRLINKATVNETYFFREERQMDLLKTKIFPELKKQGRPLKIWSAACSSGEEIYSIALLAKSQSVPVELTASDINTEILEKCREGVYGENSIRQFDGAKYSFLLEPYKNKGGNFLMGEELCKSVNFIKINLADLANPKMPENLPLGQDIIFIRNVFIYFSTETRRAILKTLATKCLAEGGYIFVSMNEIASLGNEIIPGELSRKMDSNVFYFCKRT